MGLCKCPKRRVTNMFCFEHRVNVCEFCVASNHTKCIIQSYLQWLQDSDYNPICELCSKQLETEDCVRLTCYHIYHWSCLDCYARALPPTTAPAGYRCPSCKSCVFPQENLSGPVANALREKLAGVNWARNGLGLPLLSEEREVKHGLVTLENIANGAASSGTRVTDVHLSLDDEGDTNTTATGNKNFYNRGTDHQGGGPGVDYQLSGGNRRLAGYQESVGQRPYVGGVGGVIFDHDDDDKYKRRPPGEWMRRWWRNALSSQHRRTGGGGSLYRRYCAAGLTVFLVVVFLLFVMSKLGRYSVDDDPLLELNDNPQISNN